MYSKLVAAILCLCALSTLSVVNGSNDAHSSGTIPLFMWSDKLSTQTSGEILDNINSKNIEATLLTLTSSNQNSQDVLGKAVSGLQPEVVLIFVEPELRTDFVSRFGAGSFGNLNRLVSESKWSLVAPYASSTSSLLQTAITRASDSFSNVILIQDGSSMFKRLSGKVQSVKMSDAESFLDSAKSDLHDGLTDLIIVSLDKATDSDTFKSHDSAISRISSIVAAATNGDYVALYSGDASSTSDNIQWSFAHEARAPRNAGDAQKRSDIHNDNLPSYLKAPAFLDMIAPPREVTYAILLNRLLANDSNTTVPTNTTSSHRLNYFPGGVLEAFIVMAIFLAMLFTGGCALFSLQTPDKWEAPRYRRD